MACEIDSFELWRIQLPAGREIGDNMCRYSRFTVVVLALHATQADTGWGFVAKVTDGKFAQPVPWHHPVPGLSQLESEFNQVIWPTLKGKTPSELLSLQEYDFAGSHLLEPAVRCALWDLAAKEQRQPLYEFLGGPARESINAYASYLEFHLPDREAYDHYRKAVRAGFAAVKVKVGHPQPDWDLRRLELVYDATSGEAEIAVDANLAWTAEETLQRIAFFQSTGIKLAYVEDPLHPCDVEGYALLARELEIDVVGHDYVTNPADLRPILDVGGLQRLRIHSSFDYALAVSQLAEEYELPMIVGNTLFEMGVHAAVAFQRVERIEFSDLAWNDLMEVPVAVEQGRMTSPSGVGIGLCPQREMLEELSVPSDTAKSTTAVQR